MPDPPKTTPHSDIDGIHRGEKRNSKVAADLGQSAGALEQAKEEAVARPEYQDDEVNREDRTG